MSGPVGRGDYVVRQGECLVSIAHETGHLWETLWNAGANAELKRIRRDPAVLLPGDRLTIPPIRLRQEDGATEAEHKFRRRGEPARTRIVFRRGDQPRANLPCVLVIDGVEHRGSTDGDGAIEAAIPSGARGGTLRLGEGEDVEEYPVELGGLDPITETSGIQARLLHLGYDTGPADGQAGPLLRRALCEFQRRRGLPVTGEADQATRDKLQQEHGS